MVSQPLYDKIRSSNYLGHKGPSMLHNDMQNETGLGYKNKRMLRLTKLTVECVVYIGKLIRTWNR